MQVSVIISSVHRPDRLKRLLENIACQTMLPDEIILIEAGKQSLDWNIVPDCLWERVIALHSPNESLAASRDRGRLAAKGELLVFFDDDLILPNCYLEVAVRYLEQNPLVMGVGGIYQDFVNLRKRWWTIAIGRIFGIFSDGSRNRILSSGWADYVRGIHVKQITDAEWLFGCNSAVRASVFLNPKVSFETRLATWSFLEDVIFGSRVTHAYGLCMRILPALEVLHDPGLSWEKLAQ